MGTLRTALRLARDPLTTLAGLPGQGDVVPVGVGPWRAFVLCDPALIRQVLVDDRTYDKGGVVAERTREVVGNGLGTCGHADHRRQRRLIQPAFSRELVAGYADAVAGQVAAVTGSWQNGEIVDVRAATHAISTRVTCATLFATELPADELAAVAHDLDVVMTGVYRRLLVPRWLDRLPSRARRRHDRAVTRLQSLGSGLGARAAEGSLLSRLRAARDENGRGMSETELADQVMTFFIAAVDTTASTLAFALRLLADHPDVAGRVRQEADSVLAGRDPSAADLPALELTSRVVTETLRLYPPLWLLTRVTTAASELGGHHIPVGATVVCSPYLVHHHPDFHPEPARFDPDRHAGRLPREALAPFGAGARRCIGDSYAMAEATLTLAALAACWRFEPIPGDRLRPAPRFILAPRTVRLRTMAR